jgi:hypothetical protein
MALVSQYDLDYSEGQRAYLLPLFNGDGSAPDPSARLFTFWRIVRVGVLSDIQGGLRAGRSTVDQLFCLREISAMRSELKIPTFMAFIDVYDTVHRPSLWLKLSQLGLGGRCLDLLAAMCSKVTRTVMVQGHLTEDFDMAAGVPQGAVLYHLCMPLTIMVYTRR